MREQQAVHKKADSIVPLGDAVLESAPRSEEPNPCVWPVPHYPMQVAQITHSRPLSPTPPGTRSARPPRRLAVGSTDVDNIGRIGDVMLSLALTIDPDPPTPTAYHPVPDIILQAAGLLVSRFDTAVVVADVS